MSDQSQSQESKQDKMTEQPSTKDQKKDQKASKDDSETTSQGQKQATNEEEKPKKRKRRPPLVPWKKPKDMPRRPLSAYNIFFKEQREKMMGEAKAAAAKAAAEAAASGVPETTGKKSRRRSNKSVGIGFANLARTIAGNWKELDPKLKAPYEETAATEKERYNKEMLVWRAKQKKLKEEEQAAKEKDQDKNCDSGEDASADGAHSPLPVPISQPDVEPLPLESPKKSPKMAYGSSRRITELPGIASIQLDDPPLATGNNNNNPSHNPNWMDSWGHRSDPGMFQNMSSLENEMMMHQQAQSRFGMSQINCSPFNQSDSMLNNFNSTNFQGQQGMGGYSMQAIERLRRQEQIQQLASRRYSWAGANDMNVMMGGRGEPIRRNSDDAATRHQQLQQQLQQQQRINGYPDTWGELGDRLSASQRDQASTSKLYPDTWFEVNEPNSQGDSVRYSSAGDLSGKLVPQRPNETDNSWRMSDLKNNRGRNGYGESKLDEMKRSNSSSAYSPNPCAPQRPQVETDSEPISGPSLHSLGMQLDDEAVDFIAKLRFAGNTEG